MLEIWQADVNGIFRDPADGRHREVDPGFAGWGRAVTGKDGRYCFTTNQAGRGESTNRRTSATGLPRACASLQPLARSATALT